MSDMLRDSGDCPAAASDKLAVLAAFQDQILPVATYFEDSDCVEFVKEDGIAIYRRIDEFLTLVFDETRINLIGFKLKGFGCVYNEFLKPIKELKGVEFVELVPAIEHMCTKIGHVLVTENQRRNAYVAAMKLAKGVRLYSNAA